MRDIISSDTKRKLAFFFNSLTKEKETFAASLHDLLQSKIIILKEEEGKVIAAAGVQKNNSFFIVVASEHQNRGNGQKLTKEVIRQTAKRNYSHITLNVLYSNTKAVRIFQKFGFKQVYSWLGNGKKWHFMILTLNWRGKLAKNIFFVRHQFFFLSKLFNILPSSHRRP